MKTNETALSACTDPALGARIDEYLDGVLAAHDSERFEAHYFSCRSCLEQIEMRQALGAALSIAAAPGDGTARRDASGSAAHHMSIGPARFVRRTSWVAAGVAAALVTVLWLAGTRRPEDSAVRKAVVVRIDGVYRGAGSDGPSVTAGALPVELSLFVPVSRKPGVRYAVRIEDGSGSVVQRFDPVTPATDSRLSVVLPRGFSRPGLYRVIISESGDPEEDPLEFQYDLPVIAGIP